MSFPSGARRLLTGLALMALVLPQAARAQDKDLTIFDWSGYEDPGFHPAYVKKHKKSPVFSFFGDEEEAFQKLRAGFKADIAHPCSQSINKWREAGLLEPLDTSRLAHWNDVMPGIKAMKNLMTSEDGQAWMIPFEWGNTAVLFRSDKIKSDQVTSLQIFADPKYKGKVSIGDNVDDAYALASLAIGVTDWTKLTDEQFAAASDFLRKVHKNVRTYWADNSELSQAMKSGEVQLAWAWNETKSTLQKDKVKVVMKRDVTEGYSTWVCGYARLKGGAGNVDKAYDFLNAVTSPEIGPYIVSEWGYGTGNAKGMAAADKAALKDGGFDNLDKFIDRTLFQSPVPPALKQKMNAEFEKIKAGY